MARKYRVEGWQRSTCVKVRNVARASTVIREAWHQALDKGADRVWVYRNGERDAIYTFDGLFWKKHAGDAALAQAIEEEEQGK